MRMDRTWNGAGMITTIIGYYALVCYVLLQIIGIIGCKYLSSDILLRISVASGFALLTAVLALK